MSKNTNLSFLTDYITADITNGRIGINNASPTVAFDVTGATKITGVLTLTSTISNGTYTYTLPSATGTLALTSALSGYLPLTGGTLTGALNGTSATFSGSITSTVTNALVLSNNTSTTQYVYMSLANSVGNARYGVDNSSGGGLGTGTSANSAVFGNAGNADVDITTNNISRLKIASTGAATFSGEIKSGDTITLGAAAVGGFWTWGSTTAYLVAGTGKALNLNPNGTSGTTGLSIATTGAATFSSSVQIGSTLNNSLSVGSAAPTTDTLNQIFAGQAAFGGQNSAGGETDIGHNWYYYSGWKYRFTSSSSNIKLNGDVISFERAASGTANAAITFSESMRITSGGNVLIGTTSDLGGNNKLQVSSAADTFLAITSTTGAFTTRLNMYAGGGGSSVITQSGGTGVLYVVPTTAGVYMTSGATSWTANSDEKLKNINSNIDNALDKLMTLRAVNFSWKSDETKKENLGLIAQDVEKVFPQVIDKTKLPSNQDEVVIDETEYLGVRYTDLIPVLVKAIQELSAEITIISNKIK